MSVRRGNGQNGGHFYSNITQPVKIDCQFVVNSTDSGGFGITSLKSNGYVNAVYMNTSATPATGSANPAAGDIVIQLKNNYNKFLGSFVSFISPVTGSNLTSTTNHVKYVITALGTATTAQWVAAGVPSGIVPAVGVSFVAKATGTIGGSATVKAVGVSGVLSLELAGSPDLNVTTSIGTFSGEYLVGQFLGATSSSVTTLIPTAPAAGTVVNISMFFDASSVTIDGL